MSEHRSKRSNSYPSYTIAECLELTKVIYSNFGDSIYVSRIQIAKVLNKAEPTIQTLVSSAGQYGFLEVKPKDGYKVSSAYRKIHKPLPDTTEKEDALYEAFLRPKLYQGIIEGISEGQQLKVAGLATILFRSHGISENVCEKAAEVFIENARFLELLDADGAFHRDQKNQETEQEKKRDEVVDGKNNEVNQDKKIDPTVKDSNKFTAPEGYIPYNVRLKGGRLFQFFTPSDFSGDDIVTVIKNLDLMKETMD